MSLVASSEVHAPVRITQPRWCILATLRLPLPTRDYLRLSSAIPAFMDSAVLLQKADAPVRISSPTDFGGTRPQPAGSNPSEITLMVRQQKAASEIEESLGETAVVTHRTWVIHLYSCDYRFRSGNMILR